MQSIVSYPDRGQGGNSKWRGNFAPQLIEDLIDQPKPGVSHEPFAGRGHNTGGFLATVLQRVQPQVC